MDSWILDKMDMEVERKRLIKEETSLHEALEEKDFEKALELIPTADDLDMPEPDYLLTPLHLAVRAGSLEVTKALIEAGANPDPRDDAGQSPLHEAAYGGFLEIIKYLLDQNVKINTQAFGRGMYSPLMTAVRYDQIEATELLLKEGGDRHAKDKRGHSCISYAQEKPWLKELLNKIPPAEFQMRVIPERPIRKKIPRYIDESTTRLRLATKNLEKTIGENYEEIFPNSTLPEKTSFCLLEISSGKVWAYNPEEARERTSPGENFYLPLTLLAAELKSVDPINEKFEWKRKYSYAWTDCSEPSSLVASIKEHRSWCFCRIAKELGNEIIEHALIDMKYGNQRFGDSNFWNSMDLLKLSPFDQLGFLRFIYSGNSPFKRKTIDEVFIEIKPPHLPPSYSVHLATNWPLKLPIIHGWASGTIGKPEPRFAFCCRVYKAQDEPTGEFTLSKMALIIAMDFLKSLSSM